MTNTDSILILQYNFTTFKEIFIAEQSCLQDPLFEAFRYVQ